MFTSIDSGNGAAPAGATPNGDTASGAIICGAAAAATVAPTSSGSASASSSLLPRRRAHTTSTSTITSKSSAPMSTYTMLLDDFVLAGAVTAGVVGVVTAPGAFTLIVADQWPWLSLTKLSLMPSDRTPASVARNVFAVPTSNTGPFPTLPIIVQHRIPGAGQGRSRATCPAKIASHFFPQGMPTGDRGTV